MNTVKLTVTETEKRTSEVEVPLPIYRALDTGGDDYDAVYYTRIDVGPDGPRTVTLHYVHYWNTGTKAWQVEVEPFRQKGDTADYLLGRGRYALTPEKWEEKRAEMEAWMREAGAL